MAKFYFQLFACFCFALKWEGNVEASDKGRCDAVKTAIKKNATWTVRSAQKTITWIGYATAATKLKNCCTPEGGELGDISSVKYTDSKTDAVYSNNLCLNCPGLQDVPVTDFNFTVGTTDHGISVTDTGSCSEVSVYRCRCLKPTTTTEPPATTTTTTEPPTTTTITAGPTSKGDDYRPPCGFPLTYPELSFECGKDNPCVAGKYDYGVAFADTMNTLQFKGTRGPSSYVQCTTFDDSCTEMNCPDNRVFRQSDCHCVNP